MFGNLSGSKYLHIICVLLLKLWINIFLCRPDQNGLSTLTFADIQAPSVDDQTAGVDLLWRISWPLKSARPSWSAFMGRTQTGVHPGKSSVFFMPVIDENPGDMSCIYTTLHFVAAQAMDKTALLWLHLISHCIGKPSRLFRASHLQATLRTQSFASAPSTWLWVIWGVLDI